MTVRAGVAALVFGGLLMAPGAGAQSLELSDVEGCWTLAWGRLAAWEGADSVYYRPPPFVRFATGPALRVEVPEGSVPSPHRRTSWSLSGDTLHAWWSTGFVGVRVRMTPDDSVLTGTMQTFTDVIGEPHPTAPVRATPRPCDAPFQHPASALRPLPRGITLATGERITLGDPLPEGLDLREGRLGTRIVGETAGLFAGATSIQVARDGGGLVSSIRLDIAGRDSESVARAIAADFGPWDMAQDQWRRWQGRSETLHIGPHPTRGLRVTLRDPRMGL